MNIAKVIRERIRRNMEGVDVEADVNAVVAANVGERGQTTSVSSTSTASAGSRPAKNPKTAPEAPQPFHWLSAFKP
ncbi:MAG: hypothetical protein H0V45_09620 [Actinobacteria bacterium]|nr:hypothetical protein [Actinomycetota bacterium]